MKKFSQIAGLVGIVALVLGASVGLAQQRWSLIVIAHLVAGAGLSVLGVAANFGEIKEALARRAIRMGPQVLAQALLILVILLILNIIVFRHDQTADLTTNRLYTLQKPSLDVGKNLPGPIEVIAFFPGGGPSEARQRLQLYATRFPRFKLKFVDPDKNEDLARAEGIPPEMGVLFKYKQNRIWIAKFEETDITNGLIKVTRSSSPKVWFTTGHAEPPFDDNKDNPNGLSYLKQMLSEQGYDAKNIDLNTIERIPEDISMVAVVGPGLPFTDHEIKVLDYFLGQGGNAVVFLDPVYVISSITGMEKFIEPFGLRADFDLVLDPKSHMAEDRVGLWMVVTDLPDGPITQNLTERRTVFYLARSLNAADNPPPGVSLQPLAKSSADSLAKALEPQDPARFANKDEFKTYLQTIMDSKPGPRDARGPFFLAYAVEKNYSPTGWKRQVGIDRSRSMRLVVVGTSALVRNLSITMPFNQELAMNIFNWLAGENDLKVINSPKRGGSQISLDEAEKDRLLYLTVLILPEIFVMVGLAVWWRRR